MRASTIHLELEAERNQLLAEILSIGEAGGVPKDYSPSADPLGEHVRVVMERGRRAYSLDFDDRGFTTILSAPDRAAFLEQVFCRATSKMADEGHRSRMAAGLSPSEVRFETWADLLSGVRPDWGERLRRRKGELLGLPGSLKL